MGTLIKIVKLGRLQFTFGILMYFLIGTLFALLLNAQFDLSKFIWGYLILFMASMATHYSNDYFDFEVDQVRYKTPFSGGSSILVENPELKRVIKKISLLFHCLIHTNWSRIYSILLPYPISFFFFVLFGNALVWFYSAPPIKLAYSGVGRNWKSDKWIYNAWCRIFCNNGHNQIFPLLFSPYHFYFYSSCSP